MSSGIGIGNMSGGMRTSSFVSNNTSANHTVASFGFGLPAPGISPEQSLDDSLQSFFDDDGTY